MIMCLISISKVKKEKLNAFEPICTQFIHVNIKRLIN